MQEMAESCVDNMTRWRRMTDWKRKWNSIQKRKADSFRTVLWGGPSRFIDLLTYRLARSSLASSTLVVMSCFCITGACTILSGYNIPDTFYEMFYLIASPGTWLFSPFHRTMDEVNQPAHNHLPVLGLIFTINLMGFRVTWAMPFWVCMYMGASTEA